MSEPDLVVETTEKGKFSAGKRADIYYQRDRVKVDLHHAEVVYVEVDVLERELDNGDLRVVE